MAFGIDDEVVIRYVQDGIPDTEDLNLKAAGLEENDLRTSFTLNKRRYSTYQAWKLNTDLNFVEPLKQPLDSAPLFPKTIEIP